MPPPKTWVASRSRGSLAAVNPPVMTSCKDGSTAPLSSQLNVETIGSPVSLVPVSLVPVSLVPVSLVLVSLVPVSLVLVSLVLVAPVSELPVSELPTSSPAPPGVQAARRASNGATLENG